MNRHGPPLPRATITLALCLSTAVLPALSPAADAPTEPKDRPAAAATPSVQATQPVVEAPPAGTPEAANGVPTGPQEFIRLNFKGAPLDTVLDYLSKTAGFIIIKQTELTGTVDIASHHPLTHTEVVELLNNVLAAKGMAAIRSDRTLRIVSREDAKKYDLPVQSGADPEAIPKAESMVTQIIPIRYANAPKLLENLKPLLHSYADVSANESSNALLITDTQTNVRRIASIIAALDTSISSVSEIKVFPLQHAVAEELAEVINKAFTTPTSQDSRSSSRNDRMRSFFTRMRGGMGGPGGPGGDSSPEQTDNRAASTKVTAVGDERSNCLVVSAPGDLIADIEMLVEQVDIPVEETRSLKVFPLKYAKAEDMADAITTLFQQSSTTTNNSRGSTMGSPFGMRGSMRGGDRGRGGGTSSNTPSDRKLQEAQVTAVADVRTNSVIVTASQDSLAMVAQMIEGLDATPENVPQVYIYRIQHADLEKLQEMLEGMFDDIDTTSSAANTARGGARTLTNTAATVRIPQ